MILLKLDSHCPVCETRLKYEETSGTWHCFTCSVRQSKRNATQSGNIRPQTVHGESSNSPGERYQ